MTSYTKQLFKLAIDYLNTNNKLSRARLRLMADSLRKTDYTEGISLSSTYCITDRVLKRLMDLKIIQRVNRGKYIKI